MSVDSEEIRRRLSPEFAAHLLERGLARNVIWRNGETDGGPAFSRSLSDDLLDYGIGMLSHAMNLRNSRENDSLALLAFERAAQSIETVVRDGDPNDESHDFYTVIAAAAYHLARFNARAFILLREIPTNLATDEVLFANFVLRRFGEMRAMIRSLHRKVEQRDPASYDELEPGQLIEEAFSLNYHLAIAAILAYFATGDETRLALARERLQVGAERSAQYRNEESWLLYELTRLIVGDLGEQSYYAVLRPVHDSPALSDVTERFIRRLAAKTTAQVDLWPSQVKAAHEAYTSNADLVVSLPTSGGKTRVAQIAMLPTLARGLDVVYVTPLRALCAQIENDLADIFEELHFSVSRRYRFGGRAEDVERPRIRVATPESLDFELRRDLGTLERVGLVVFDEAHLIGTAPREVRYELLIERLRRHHCGSRIRFVCLSAMFEGRDDLRTFTEWISRDATDKAITSSWRPTRQTFGTITWSKDHARLDLVVGGERPYIDRFVQLRQVPTLPGEKKARNYPNSDWDLVLDSAIGLAREEESVLIYCPEKRSVNTGADHLVDYFRRGLVPSDLLVPGAISDEQTLELDEWLGPDHDVARCLKNGVAIHHGSLPDEVLAIAEGLIQRRIARLIIASPSVAQGVNVSASSLLFQSLTRFNPDSGRQENIEPEEFRNVVGRAGRAFVDINGRILFSVGLSEDDAATRRERWNSLLEASATRTLESGLVRLLEQLLERAELTQHDAVEFVAAHANIDRNIDTGAPVYTDEDYSPDVDILDDVIVQLLEDADPSPDEAVTLIDSLLQDALFARTLKQRDDSTRASVLSALRGRTVQVVQRFPVGRRRASYRSGVPVRHSASFEDLVLELEDNVRVLREHLMAVGQLGNEEVEKLSEIVVRLLSFPTFAYRVAETRDVQDRALVVAAWLRGEALSSVLERFGDAALPLIDEGVRCSAVWGLDAVQALMDQDLPEQPTAARVLSRIVGAGVPSVVGASLLRIGLRSRVLATKLGAVMPMSHVIGGDWKRWLEFEGSAFVESLDAREVVFLSGLLRRTKRDAPDLMSDSKTLRFVPARPIEVGTQGFVFRVAEDEFQVTDLDLHTIGSGKHTGLSVSEGGGLATFVAGDAVKLMEE